MADNVQTQVAALATIPSGTTIATDEIAGAMYQRVKVTHGADGVATDASAANPLPVDSEINQKDIDTGAGTDMQAAVALLVAAAGGGTLVSTANGLPVNVVAGSAANAAASNTGAAVPSAADYQGINVGGTLRGATGAALGAHFAQAIAVVDASGNQITSFGGTAGVVTGYHRVSSGTAGDEVSIVVGAKKLKAVHVFNKADTPRYVKFHDVAVAPTLGAGVVRTYGVQGGTQRDALMTGGGLAFTNGIGMSFTTGPQDGDTNRAAADDLVVEVEYE